MFFLHCVEYSRCNRRLSTAHFFCLDAVTVGHRSNDLKIDSQQICFLKHPSFFFFFLIAVSCATNLVRDCFRGWFLLHDEILKFEKEELDHCVCGCGWVHHPCVGVHMCGCVRVCVVWCACVWLLLLLSCTLEIRRHWSEVWPSVTLLAKQRQLEHPRTKICIGARHSTAQAIHTGREHANSNANPLMWTLPFTQAGSICLRCACASSVDWA